MDRVHTVAERPLSTVPYVAVAIKAVRPNQQHIGILHRGVADAVPKLLHLAWHHQLRDEQPDDTYIWVDPALPSGRARQVAARCRQILRANGRYVPYGFSPPTVGLDEVTGRYLFGPTSTGLTCASFVLAVFEFAQVRLIDYASWQPRPEEDRQWQEWLVAQLRATGAPVEHVHAVEREVGCARYRPEEVASAVALHPPTVRFEAARELAVKLLPLLTP